MADEKLVKVEALARLFNLTARRIQQLANEGIVVKAGRGTYDLVASIHGYIRFLQDQIEGKPTTDMARQVNAQRLRSLEIDNDAKEGKYLARDVVEQVMSACMATVGRIVDAIDSRIPPLMEGDKTAAERRLIVKGETRAIRTAAANELRALAGVADDGRHHQASTGKNGSGVGKSKRRPASGKR